MLEITDFGLLNEEQKKIVAAFLSKDPVQEFWPLGKKDGVLLHFRIIKHFSANRPERERPIRIRYEVMDNIVFAQGNFGTYYRSLYTLSIDKEGMLHVKKREPNKLRLIKEQTKVGATPEEVVRFKTYFRNEAKAMEKNRFFHSKPLVEVNNRAYIIVRQLPGKELFQLIESNQLTIKERYDLTLKLLIALQQQIHDNGWLHRDIKPENILVYKESSTFWVYIIDYGFIKLFDYDDSREPVGSALYAAPEIFNLKSKTEKTDIYAMGRVLMYLWGDSNTTVSPNTQLIFDMMPEVPPCALEIKEILSSMCLYDMEKRPSIAALVSSFRKLESKLAPVKQSEILLNREAVHVPEMKPTVDEPYRLYCGIV